MNISTFWKRTLVGGAAALTLAAGLLITTGVETSYAQDDTETPDKGAWEGRRGGMHGGHFSGFGADIAKGRLSRMAEALGISEEELQEKMDAMHDERLQEALENGDITQEQVDLMEAHRAVRDYIDHHALMAQALGLSVEELDAARGDGTLRDLLSGLPLDRTEIGEKLQTGMDEALNQAVIDDVITAEQADQLREQGGERGFGHKGFGKPGFGGKGSGQPDGEGRGIRVPGGFFNQSNG